MTRPMVRIHDLSTNEVIDREMNDAEFTQYETDQAATAAQAAKESANAKLAALGLTAEEIAALSK